MFASYETATDHQLVSFHIAGDNGIGKSYIAQLFSESLFYDPQHSGGFLVISGTNFQGANNATVCLSLVFFLSPIHNTFQLVAQLREGLFNLIVHQLETCPRSLIIIDDVEYIHSSTLVVLQQFMDSVPYVVKRDGTKVYKGRALLGLVSDFGQEGITSATTSLEEMENIVLAHSAQLWQLDPKQTQLIQHIFPFAPLKNADVEQLINYLVTKSIPASERFRDHLCGVSITHGALEWMRESAQTHFKAENGRGARKWVMKYVVPQLGNEVKGRNSPIHLHIALNLVTQQLVYQVKPCRAEL